MELLANALDQHKKYKSKSVILKSEFDFQIVKGTKKKFKKISYIRNLNRQLKEYNLSSVKNQLLTKKINFYRSHLKKRLNVIHNVNFSENYWGFLLDNYLADLIGCIISDLDFLTQIKNKFKNAQYKFNKNESFKIKDCLSFQIQSQDLKMQRFITGKVAEVLNFKVNNNEGKIIPVTIEKNYYLEKLKINFFFLFIKLYLFIFKPNFIVADNISLKFKLFNFFRGFGKYFYMPSKFLKFQEDFKLNQKKRTRLKVSEKDKIDKIYNKLIVNFFPTSYLENYFINRKRASFFANNAKSFGSSISYRLFDTLKILAAELKYNKKRKLIYCSHAPFENLRKFSRSFNFCKKFHDRCYAINQPNDYGKHDAYYLKKFINKEKDQVFSILIFNTVPRVFQNNNFIVTSLEVHPFLSSNLSFYKNLNKKNKKNTFVKLFPSNNKSEEISRETWLRNNKNNINFIHESNSFDSFHNYDILIINEFSTPLFEALCTERPFILLYGQTIKNMNAQTKNIFFKLKKYNLLFESGKEAAQYLNNNISHFVKNWKNVIVKNEYLSLKKLVIN